MKIISLFNNKGGVGKSTLSYHLGCALGELGKKVLFVDLDPQCNLTINAMMENELEQIRHLPKILLHVRKCYDEDAASDRKGY